MENDIKMENKTSKKSWILMFIIVIIITYFAFYTSAAVTYWHINNQDFSIGPDILFIDVTNNRVGIGDITPDFKLDVESTGNAVSGQISSTGLSYGIYGSVVSSGNLGPNSAAIYGVASGTTGTAYGGYFKSASTDGRAIRALSTESNGRSNVGGYFLTESSNGYGVWAETTATSGTTYAVLATTAEDRGASAYFKGGKVAIGDNGVLKGKLDVGCTYVQTICSSSSSCQSECPAGETWFATGAGCYAYNSPYEMWEANIQGNDAICQSASVGVYAYVYCCRVRSFNQETLY